MNQRAAALLSPDMLLSYACWILAGLIFYFSAAYPDHNWGMGGPPAFMPRVLAVLLAVFGLWIAIYALMIRPAAPVNPDWGTIGRVAIAAAVLFAAAFALPVIGFHLTATAAAFATIAILTPTEEWTLGRAGAALAVAAAAAVVLYLVFARVAGVRLPLGIMG